jgi:phosphohistidine swiveling domain-containing protein
MTVELPLDRLRHVSPPASPLVEATLSLVQDAVRREFADSGLDWETFCFGHADHVIGPDVFAKIELHILASGHRFDWSASISADERPEVYKPRSGTGQLDESFSHPDAPKGDPEPDGRTLAGTGDNVVRHDVDCVGIARFIRTNATVLHYLTDGVPSDMIAIIDDSGGTLTAPIIEQFSGVICAGGTVRSHLGILTREYNIPCVMNAKISGIRDGDRVRIEATAPARTTEDYQSGIERVARIWRLQDSEEARK